MSLPTRQRVAAVDSNLVNFVSDIADEMLVACPPLMNPRLGFAGGTAGQAIFLAELAQVVGGDNVYGRMAERCLDRLVGDLPHEIMAPGFYEGLAGIAWAMRSVAVSRGRIELLGDECFSEIYEYYGAFLDQHDREYEFDLVSGLAGIGLWTVTIDNRDERERLTALTLNRLQDASESDAAGVRWGTPRTRPRRYPTPAPLQVSEYNLGLAHGIAGVIGFLAECLNSDACASQAETCRGMLSSGVAWLLRQQLEEGAESSFPDIAGSTQSSRMAWCYGDPGIAAVLIKAADALQSPSILDSALRVVEKTASRQLRDSHVRDTGVCHGAAGLALIYSELYRRLPGCHSLIGQARYWRAALLEMLKAGTGIKGCYSWKAEGNRNVPDGGLLGGAAGVGLSLLDVDSDVTQWRYPLLIRMR
ncbi:MAG: lanthionine synthetase LanC family protein [Steroidobacteraceae bacterium]